MNSSLVDLLERIGRKEAAALAELHDQTAGILRLYLLGIVRDRWNAEEVLQDIYTYVWLHASAFQVDRGTPMAWLYVVARSRALDQLRRSGRRQMVSVLDEQIRPKRASHPVEEPAEIWHHALVRRGVRELPAAQERLIGLAFFEGYSHSEIAAVTGLPLGTVKTSIRSALNRLRGKLEGDMARPMAA